MSHHQMPLQTVTNKVRKDHQQQQQQQQPFQRRRSRLTLLLPSLDKQDRQLLLLPSWKYLLGSSYLRRSTTSPGWGLSKDHD